MNNKETLATIVMAIVCFLIALVSNKITDKETSLIMLQMASSVGFFSGFSSQFAREIRARGMRADSLVYHSSFILYHFTFVEPKLPIFSLSLGLGNALAMSNQSPMEVIIALIASTIIIYISCILGIILGQMIEAIKK